MIPFAVMTSFEVRFRLESAVQCGVRHGDGLCFLMAYDTIFES